MSKDIAIKEVAPQWIASVRETIPAYTAVGILYSELFATLGPSAFGGVAVALWHDHQYKEQDIDAEAGVYLQSPIPAQGRVQVHQLPPVNVASIIHHGAYNRLSEAYDAGLRWIETNGYRLAGPIRELYLHNSMPVRMDDESYVTEIQMPVEKVAA